MMILCPALWKACKASLAPGLSAPIFGYLCSTTVPSKSTAMITIHPFVTRVGPARADPAGAYQSSRS